MALLFCDSFDHYTNPLDKYATFVNTDSAASLTITTDAGRSTGGQGLKVVQGTTNGSVDTYVNPVFQPSGTLIVGFAFKSPQNTINPATNGYSIFDSILKFCDGAATQLTFGLTSTAQLAAFLGDPNASDPIGLSVGAIPLGGVWNYLEFKVAFSATAGSVEVRLNGLDIINVSGVPTITTANAFSGNILLGNPGSTPVHGGGYHYLVCSGMTNCFDDFYICDNTGANNNDFLGDVHIIALVPNGAGESTQFTPVGAAANWQAVDDTPPDGDTSYVSSATPGNKDMYTFNPLGPTGAIHGVQVCSYSRKDADGIRIVQHVVRDTLAGQESNSANLAPGTTYHYLTSVFQTAPSGTQWTYPEINAMQAGMTIIS